MDEKERKELVYRLIQIRDMVNISTDKQVMRAIERLIFKIAGGTAMMQVTSRMVAVQDLKPGDDTPHGMVISVTPLIGFHGAPYAVNIFVESFINNRVYTESWDAKVRVFQVREAIPNEGM